MMKLSQKPMLCVPALVAYPASDMGEPPRDWQPIMIACMTPYVITASVWHNHVDSFHENHDSQWDSQHERTLYDSQRDNHNNGLHNNMMTACIKSDDDLRGNQCCGSWSDPDQDRHPVNAECRSRSGLHACRVFGNKFSTYAKHAVKNHNFTNALKQVKNTQRVKF